VTLAAIALGSNLGDRRAHLDYAVSRLEGLLSSLKVSRYYETEPVDIAGAQLLFLNAAAVGTTTLSAEALLDELLRIESERGRNRPWPRAPRTLDLDLILFGNEKIKESSLIVPHARFRERRFVLEPLAEVGSDLVDPVTGLTIGALLRQLPKR
jgi:2-amino-4-hydroxy-6-hydroxymethyldihydropteridine diphosphokinase